MGGKLGTVMAKAGAPGFSGVVDASHIEMDEVSMAKLAKALQTSQSVNKLILSNCHLNAGTLSLLFDSIKENPFLRTLDLSYNRLDLDALRHVCEYLSRSGCGISSLILNAAQLGQEEITEIGRTLELNTSLRSLSLAGNNLKGEVISTLSESLMLNRTLCELDLSSNGIEDDGCPVIARLLSRATHLKTLYLRANGIGSEGCTVISHALEGNSTLDTIDFSYNKIGLDGVNELSVMLTVNNHLKQLNIAGNPIGEYGAAVLARALNENLSLKVLNLNACKLGNKGIWRLSMGVWRNCALEELWLEANGMDDSGAMQLVSALEHNRSLKNIYLDNGNNISTKLVKSIERLVAHRKGEYTIGKDSTPPPDFADPPADVLGDTLKRFGQFSMTSALPKVSDSDTITSIWGAGQPATLPPTPAPLTPVKVMPAIGKDSTFAGEEIRSAAADSDIVGLSTSEVDGMSLLSNNGGDYGKDTPYYSYASSPVSDMPDTLDDAGLRLTAISPLALQQKLAELDLNAKAHETEEAATTSTPPRELQRSTSSRSSDSLTVPDTSYLAEIARMPKGVQRFSPEEGLNRTMSAEPQMHIHSLTRHFSAPPFRVNSESVPRILVTPPQLADQYPRRTVSGPLSPMRARRPRRLSVDEGFDLERRLEQQEIENASSDSERRDTMRINRMLRKQGERIERQRRSSLPSHTSFGGNAPFQIPFQSSLLRKRKNDDRITDKTRRFRRKSVVQPTPTKPLEQNQTKEGEVAQVPESVLSSAGRRMSDVLVSTGSEALQVMNTPIASPLASESEDNDKLTPYAGAAMGLASALLVGAVTGLGDSEVSRKVVLELFGAAGGLIAAAAYMLWRGRSRAPVHK